MTLPKSTVLVLIFSFITELMVAQQPPFLRQPLTTNSHFGPLPSEGHAPIWNDTLKKWSNAVPSGFSVLNVRNPPYNAKADGSDDTLAFQQALSTDGAVVYFPAGSYSVSTLVISKGRVRLIGDGPSSRLVARIAAPMILIVDGSAQQFENFQLMGDRLATYGILLANSGSQSQYHNVEIIYCTGAPGIGIATEASSFSLLFDRCSIQNNLIGIRLWPGAQNSRINNSLIYNNTNYQVVLGSPNNMLSSVAISGSMMSGNAATNLLVENAVALTIDSCYFEASSSAGKDILIQGSSLVGINGMYSNGNQTSTNSIHASTNALVELSNSYIYNFLSHPVVGPVTVINSRFNEQ